MQEGLSVARLDARFSALQRAEIAEMKILDNPIEEVLSFSALQRAEIAEMDWLEDFWSKIVSVSVLFNEPKLLKFLFQKLHVTLATKCFSALQRAEIAEI